jgi:hypothetical protein
LRSGIPSKINENQKKIAITALVEGQTQSEAGKRAGLSHQLPDDVLREAEVLKKELHEGFTKDTGKRIENLAKRLLAIAETCAEGITPEALLKQNGYGVLLTAAIAIDKMQLLTGGATENVQVSAGPGADDFLKKLKERQAKSITIESANIEHIATITQPTEVNKSGKALKNE